MTTEEYTELVTTAAHHFGKTPSEWTVDRACFLIDHPIRAHIESRDPDALLVNSRMTITVAGEIGVAQ